MASRLNVIKSHFAFTPQPNALDNFRSAKINVPLLQEEYYSPRPDIAHMFYSLTKDNSLFDLNGNLEKPREMQREIIVRQILYLYPKFYAKYDFTNSINRALFGVAMSGFDQALSVRLLVHSILYLETLEFLGTEKHKPLVEKALTLKNYGSFSMTEIGHGTNVAGCETTATYDHAKREFVINSPTPTSAKFWIGAMANTANMTVVFAQLIMGNVKQGIHVFLVRIRDDNHDPVPGVTIGDCGAKAGLSGIDNGWIFFHNIRVPYDALLDRMSHITPEGKFKSSFKSQEKRFGIMLSGLTGGRASILGSSEVNLRNALTAAIRYAAVRLQFGGDKEQAILTYPTHKYRLMPILAKCFAARMTFQMIFNLYSGCKELIKNDPEGMKVNEMHALLSVFKYLNCRYTQDGIQECREACGGHGFSAYAGFLRLRENNDIHHTWDGDNTVLIQQCSRFLLKNIMHHFKGNPVHSSYVTFMTSPKVDITAETLNCPNKLIAMLEYRAHYYMNKTTAKLQANASTDATVAWANSQVHNMNNLSISFGELVAAKELLNFANKLKAKCPETGTEIEKVFKLYALSIMEKDHFGLNDTEHRLIEDKVVEMSDLVSKSVIKILDAIAVPDHIVSSVLGCSDGRVYERYMHEVERAPGCYGKPSWIHLVDDMKKAF